MAAAPPCATGSTYHVVTGPGERHLFVIIAGPADVPTYPPQSCVLISLSTIRTAVFDESCVFEIGEHPFVIARSFVAYSFTKQMTVPQIARLVQDGTFAPAQAFGAELVARARTGLHNSRRTPNHYKDFCLACP